MFVTVVKTNLSRCDYKITVIQNGRQVKADEIKGDAGQAAAWALNPASKYNNARIVAPADVEALL